MAVLGFFGINYSSHFPDFASERYVGNMPIGYRYARFERAEILGFLVVFSPIDRAQFIVVLLLLLREMSQSSNVITFIII